jgi:hypothetical protein
MYAHTEEHTEQLQGLYLRVCVHIYPVLIWSNANPATLLYVPPCVRTSMSCLDLEQYTNPATVL